MVFNLLMNVTRTKAMVVNHKQRLTTNKYDQQYNSLNDFDFDFNSYNGCAGEGMQQSCKMISK